MSARSSAERARERPSPHRQPPPSPQLRVVRPPRPTPSRRLIGFLGSLALLLVFSTLLGLAVLRAMIVEGGSHLQQISNDMSAAIEQGQALRVEVAQLESPERILAEAQGRLGLVVPTRRAWLVPVEPGEGSELAPPGIGPFADTGWTPPASIPPTNRAEATEGAGAGVAP